MQSTHSATFVKTKPSDLTIEKGVRVTLSGLKNASHLNGRTGMVTGDKNPMNGRFPIKVDGPYKSPSTGKFTEDIISIKEENLVYNTKAHACDGCFRQFDTKALRKCNRCRLVRYCSEECQHEHWHREHKEDCKILRSARKSTKDDSVPLPEHNGDRVWCIQNRGIRSMEKNDPEAAEKDFRRLIEVEHFDTVASYSNLGLALMMQGKLQEALPYLEKAVTLTPLDGPDELRHAYDNLSTGQMMTGHKLAAQTTLKRALEMFPGDMELKMKLEKVETIINTTEQK